MPNNKNRKRPQAQKPAALRTGNPNTLAMLLRNGEGAHGNPRAYNRTVKHKGRVSY